MNNSVGCQKTIKSNVGYRVKKTKTKNQAETIFQLYTPKHFNVNQTQYWLVNAGVDVELPEGATVVNFLTVFRSELKQRNILENVHFQEKDQLGHLLYLTKNIMKYSMSNIKLQTGGRRKNKK